MTDYSRFEGREGGCVHGHVTSKFGEITDNIFQTVQDTDAVKTNRKSYCGLSNVTNTADLEGHFCC